jgi:hypothetical protein
MRYNMPLDVTYSSPKRERGKVRGNKRQPRTYGPHGECVSYYLDEHGNKERGKVFTPSREARASKQRKRTQVNEAHATRLRLLAAAGNNSDVD